MARKPSPIILAAQAARAEARAIAIASRLERLTALAPNANPEDLKYIAIMCNSNPTFPALCRLLASNHPTPKEN